MNRKIKNRFALLLVLVFILPTIIKIEHHHNYNVFSAHQQATNYHQYQGKCAICDFEFSFFLTAPLAVDLNAENAIDGCFNHYESPDYSTLSQFSFLLRGPPIVTNRM